MKTGQRSNTLVGIVIFLAVVLLGGAYECASYSECRRVHPIWYCLR